MLAMYVKCIERVRTEKWSALLVGILLINYNASRIKSRTWDYIKDMAAHQEFTVNFMGGNKLPVGFLDVRRRRGIVIKNYIIVLTDLLLCPYLWCAKSGWMARF